MKCSNHPLLITIKKLAPALAAGNSVIVKPSELAPLTALELGKIAKEAGIPDGVLSILPGYGAIAGKALVESPVIRKVDVTVRGKLPKSGSFTHTRKYDRVAHQVVA